MSLRVDDVWVRKGNGEIARSYGETSIMDFLRTLTNIRDEDEQDVDVQEVDEYQVFGNINEGSTKKKIDVGR